MTSHDHLPLHPLRCDCPECAVRGPGDRIVARAVIGTLLVAALAWAAILAPIAAIYLLVRA